jgi:hypothetical protein
MQFVCPRTATAICIPELTTEIIPAQPQNTVVESVTFESPARVRILPFQVFAGCIFLKSVCIPISVTMIDESAFSHCHALSMVVFESPSTVTEFESGSFAFCLSLKTITIPPSLVHIRDECFEQDECLSEVIFESPSQLTSIGRDVFSGCFELSKVSLFNFLAA